MTRFTRIVSAAAILAFTFHLIADSRKVLKVAITAGGQITADGHPTTLEALIPMLRELAKNKGEVWYYREVPEADPHPNAMKLRGHRGPESPCSTFHKAGLFRLCRRQRTIGSTPLMYATPTI